VQEDSAKATIAFWDDVAKQTGLAETQRTQAVANATRARMTLAREEMNDGGSWQQKQTAALDAILLKVASNAKTTKALHEDEAKATIAFWDQVAKDTNTTEDQRTVAVANATRARLSLAREEVAERQSNSQKSLHEQLAELSEQQAANHDNYAQVLQLENQKLALLKAAGANYTKEYESELAKRDNMERQHAAQVVQLAEEAEAKQKSVDDQEIAQKKSDLAEEVTQHEISKAQEIQQLITFTNEKRALEIQAMEDTLATIDKQSAAWQKLYDKIGLAKAQWATEDKRLNNEVTSDLDAKWQSALAPISGAFDSSLSGVIQGTQTVQQAFARMAGSVILSYVRMGVEATTKWGASQLAMLFSTQTTEAAKTAAAAGGAATRNAISNTETQTEDAGILTRIGRFLFGETTKTAATTSGAATRNVARTSETTTENAGLLVRIARWIATELGMTGATTENSAQRTTTTTLGATAADAATALSARAQVAAAASVAAAWAFADSASLGPVGLAAAPAAAATAFGEVMVYQATIPGLAVGAWNLPADMPANLHAGEMVVPANFASGLRSALGGGGSASSSSQTINYAPKIQGGSSPDMAGLMQSQARDFKSYLWHATRNGALALPGR
jgi:hypothetical protein